MPPLLFIDNKNSSSIGGSNGSISSPPSSPELIPTTNRLQQLEQKLLPPRGVINNNNNNSSLSRPPRTRSRTSSSGGGFYVGSPPRNSSSGGSGSGSGSGNNSISNSLPDPPLHREGSSSSLSTCGGASAAGVGGDLKEHSSSSSSLPCSDDSHGETERALERAISSHGPHSKECGPIYNHLGNMYFRKSLYKQASDCYKKAIQCDPGDHLGDAYANLGTVYWTTGKIDRAIPVLHQALATYELDAVAVANAQDGQHQQQKNGGGGQMAILTVQVANVHHQLGLAYCLREDYQKSIDCLNRAREIREARGDHLSVARTFDAVGKVLYCQGSMDAALLHHQQALSILRVMTNSENNIKDSSSRSRSVTATTLSNIAQVYTHKEEWGEAIDVYSELLKEQKTQFLTAQGSFKSVVEPAKALHETLLSAAYCYQRLEANDEANHCLHEANVLAKECGLLNF